MSHRRLVSAILSLAHYEYSFKRLVFFLSVTLALLFINPSIQAQEEESEDVEATELEDPTVTPATDIEEVVVTGSRLKQSPGDLAGQLVVLDAEAIRAMGEVTLERVLRQLPQNVNSTSERIGQSLNGVNNLSGASTVNLRGLGSESTLILVDGKRIGYNGFIGGVTDVSSIPLNMVERIEVVLDGASAIYGSDAVGGVVNIITRNDYEGVEVSVNLDWPDGGAYQEFRGSVSFSQVVGDEISIRGGYQRSQHTGLDAKDREVTLFNQSQFDGPQYDVRFCCDSDGNSFPVMYRHNGELITLSDYRALSEAEQAAAEAIHYATLPAGFNENSTLASITEIGMTTWGAATQEGRSVLPETSKDSFHVSISKDFDRISVDAQVRAEKRNTLNQNGYTSIGGRSLHGGNPSNPFGRTVHLRGQRRDMPQPYLETVSDRLDFNLELSGYINNAWEWEASVGHSLDESESGRYNNLNGTVLAGGMNSDGVTSSTLFFFGETAESCAARGGRFGFGLCRVVIPPLPSINPFGDLSEYITDKLSATSTNSQLRIEGLVRGELFEAPAGTARGLIGFSHHTTGLESSTEFQIGTLGSVIDDSASFDTQADRTNYAIFAEASVPLIDSGNAIGLIQGLNLSLSARRDTYDAPDVTYRDAGTALTEDYRDPGSESTFGIGFVWTYSDALRWKLSYQTAFVAPQINQLLIPSSQMEAQPFRGLQVIIPGGFRYVDTLIVQGGNPDLLPETAVTASLGFDYNPIFWPDAGFKVTYSETDYENRISRFDVFLVDEDNLPSNTTYIESEDLFVQERRWINVSEVERAGLDYEFLYGATTDHGDWNLHLKRSLIRKYSLTPDPGVDEAISVVGRAEIRTGVSVVPEKSTNMQLTWAHRGLEAAVDVSTRSKTATSIAGVTSVYSPPTQIDLSISYEMNSGNLIKVPAMLEGGRITFIVNNLMERFGTSKIYSQGGAELPQTSPDASPLYGRVFSIAYTMVL